VAVARPVHRPLVRRPLHGDDGCAPEESQAAAERVGVELPIALVEWFELLGSRLQQVQDEPATPSRLRTVQGRPVVWAENQRVWSILTDGEGEGPLCVLDDPTAGAWAATPLSVAVQAMLASDTLVGVWSDTGCGSLGRLNASVRGGALVDATQDEVDRLFSGYPPLPRPANPFWDTPVRGDANTLLRGSLDWGWGSSGRPPPRPPTNGSPAWWISTRPAGSTNYSWCWNGRDGLTGGSSSTPTGHYDSNRSRPRSPEASAISDRPEPGADKASNTGSPPHDPQKPPTRYWRPLPRRLRGKVTVKERPVRVVDYRTLQAGSPR
jgi:hypothetical protein